MSHCRYILFIYMGKHRPTMGIKLNSDLATAEM